MTRLRNFRSFRTPKLAANKNISFAIVLHRHLGEKKKGNAIHKAMRNAFNVTGRETIAILQSRNCCHIFYSHLVYIFRFLSFLLFRTNQVSSTANSSFNPNVFALSSDGLSYDVNRFLSVS